MADLEEYGFVTSPHTSAGRVPTDKGYRFFVDTLLRQRQRPDDDAHAERVEPAARAGADRDPKALVAAASQMLSSLTHLAGVVTIPRQPHQSLSQIEFLPLSENRVLAVMVVNGREVQNRIVHLERYYSAEELRRAAEFPQRAVRRQGTRPDPRWTSWRELHAGRRNDEPADAGRHPRGAAGGGREQPPGRARVRDRGRDQPDGIRRALERRKLRRLFEAFTRSATSCTCWTRAWAPRASRSSSARNRATRSSTTAAWSRPPTRSTTRRSACSASSARPAWPMSG